MRWMLLLVFVAGLSVGCDKEIHEARTPLQAPVVSAR
jgi:hypothetical protein